MVVINLWVIDIGGAKFFYGYIFVVCVVFFYWWIILDYLYVCSFIFIGVRVSRSFFYILVRV